MSVELAASRGLEERASLIEKKENDRRTGIEMEVRLDLMDMLIICGLSRLGAKTRADSIGCLWWSAAEQADLAMSPARDDARG